MKRKVVSADGKKMLIHAEEKNWICQQYATKATCVELRPTYLDIGFCSLILSHVDEAFKRAISTCGLAAQYVLFFFAISRAIIFAAMEVK